MAVPWNAPVFGVWKNASAGQIVRDAAQKCRASVGKIDEGPVIAEFIANGITLDEVTLHMLLLSGVGAEIGARDGVLTYTAGFANGR